MKKFLIEMAWLALAGVSIALYSGIGDLVRHYGQFSPIGLGLSLLSFAPLTGMAVGFRRGFPDGIWGIK